MTFVFPKDLSIIINSKNRHSSLVNLALISINMYVLTFLKSVSQNVVDIGVS